MNNEGKIRVSALNALVAEITLELLRAVDLHPIDNRTPLEWLAIIGEEYGEAQKAAVQTLFEPDEGVTWLDHRTELVQTAATVLRAILALDTYTINAPQQPAAEPKRHIVADHESPECVVCTGKATKPRTKIELDNLCQGHYDYTQYRATITAVHPSGCVLCLSPVTHTPARLLNECLTTAEIKHLCSHHSRAYEDAVYGGSGHND